MVLGIAAAWVAGFAAFVWLYVSLKSGLIESDDLACAHEWYAWASLAFATAALGGGGLALARVVRRTGELRTSAMLVALSAICLVLASLLTIGCDAP